MNPFSTHPITAPRLLFGVPKIVNGIHDIWKPFFQKPYNRFFSKLVYTQYDPRAIWEWAQFSSLFNQSQRHNMQFSE